MASGDDLQKTHSRGGQRGSGFSQLQGERSARLIVLVVRVSEGLDDEGDTYL